MRFLYIEKGIRPPSCGDECHHHERIRGSTLLVLQPLKHAITGMRRLVSGDGILQMPAARACSLWRTLSLRGFFADVFSFIHQERS